jgi:hypothetical protein
MGVRTGTDMHTDTTPHTRTHEHTNRLTCTHAELDMRARTHAVPS